MNHLDLSTLSIRQLVEELSLRKGVTISSAGTYKPLAITRKYSDDRDELEVPTVILIDQDVNGSINS